MNAFSIIQYPSASGEIRLGFIGSLSRNSAPLINELQNRLSEMEFSRLKIDFSALDDLTADGLYLLCIFCTQNGIKHRDLQFEGLSLDYRPIFTLTHLEKMAFHSIQPSSQSKFPASQTADTPQKATGHWAEPVFKANLQKKNFRNESINVHGRRLTSPVTSFGRMWKRSYRVNLFDVDSPQQIMSRWKEGFPSFWPPGSQITSTTSDFEPGAICLIQLTLPPGLRLSTGAVVIYSDSTSFTLMTLQGHMFSGFITFSSYQENGNVYAQTEALIRPNDFLYEFAFRIGFGTKEEDQFWISTMRNVADHFMGDNIHHPKTGEWGVETDCVLLDPYVHWQYFGNIWYNAAIRSGIYQMLSPLRGLLGGNRKTRGNNIENRK